MVFAVVLSAGISTRFKSSKPKMLASIHKKPLYQYVPDTCLKNKNINHIVLITNPSLQKEVSKYYKKQKKIKVVLGNTKSRIDSLKNAIKYLQNNFVLAPTDIILTLDGDRPFVSNKLINKHLSLSKKAGYTTTVLPIYDSMLNKKNCSYINRNEIYSVQTPQCIQYKFWTSKTNIKGTDLFSCLNLKINHQHLVDGELTNIKITTKEDLDFANQIKIIQ